MKASIMTPVAITLGLLIAVSTASAERPGAKHDSAIAEKRITKMQKRLDLSDDQVEEMQEIRENGGSRAQIIAVLSEEQRAKMNNKRRKLSTGG